MFITLYLAFIVVVVFVLSSSFDLVGIFLRVPPKHTHTHRLFLLTAVRYFICHFFVLRVVLYDLNIASLSSSHSVHILYRFFVHFGHCFCCFYYNFSSIEALSSLYRPGIAACCNVIWCVWICAA